MVFKNWGCYDNMPDAWGHAFGAIHCNRKANHKGPHRRKYRDGGVREWKDGDLESRLVVRPSASRKIDTVR